MSVERSPKTENCPFEQKYAFPDFGNMSDIEFRDHMKLQGNAMYSNDVINDSVFFVPDGFHGFENFDGHGKHLVNGGIQSAKPLLDVSYSSGVISGSNDLGEKELTEGFSGDFTVKVTLIKLLRVTVS